MDVGPKSQFCRQLFAFDILSLSTYFSSGLTNTESITKVIHFNRWVSFEFYLFYCREVVVVIAGLHRVSDILHFRDDTFSEAFGRLLKGSPAIPKHDGWSYYLNSFFYA